MSSTTTVYPSEDTKLDEAKKTQNYGGDATIDIGATYKGGAYSKNNAVFKFDVSGITNPSTITKAIFTLVFNSSALSSTTQTVTLARLNQDFAEATATWNEPSGTVASWTGGAGAFGNAELTQEAERFCLLQPLRELLLVQEKDSQGLRLANQVLQGVR